MTGVPYGQFQYQSLINIIDAFFYQHLVCSPACFPLLYSHLTNGCIWEQNHNEPPGNDLSFPTCKTILFSNKIPYALNEWTLPNSMQSVHRISVSYILMDTQAVSEMESFISIFANACDGFLM